MAICEHPIHEPDRAAQLATVGVPTRNRPQSLERCLCSILENGRRHGRAADIVVIDDSEDYSTQEANRQVLRSLRARCGAGLFYAGPGEKARYAQALAKHAHLSPEIVRFALLGYESCPVRTGSSRNALLLHTTGETLLQMDDDTICEVAQVPDAQGGLRLSSAYDPTEFWFFAEDEPVPPRSALLEEDFLAAHEQLLGKSLSACIGSVGPGNGLDFYRASATFFRRQEPTGGKVLVTAAGVAGDSGMGSSVYFLSLEGDSRARLLRSETVYRHALARRQVVRSVTQPTVSEGDFCMSVNLGLDNRDLLPPFMPVQRNQDGIFGSLLRACWDSGSFGFLPRALLHRSEVRCSSTDLRTSVSQFTTGQAIQALVRAFVPGPNRADPADALRAVGRSLADWGSAPQADFEELVRLVLWGQMSRLASQWENQLREHSEHPTFWAKDVKLLLVTLREALPSPSYQLPCDLSAVYGAEDTRPRFQQLVCRFGELLQAWPQMVDAARELRARGIRPAERAGRSS
jgi:hypothetical protein